MIDPGVEVDAFLAVWLVGGLAWLVMRARQDRRNRASIDDLERQIANNASHWRVRGHVAHVAMIDGRPRIVLARIGEDPADHRDP